MTAIKKFIMMAAVAVVAMCGVACNNDDDATYSVKGNKYIGTLTTERNTDGYDDIVQSDIVFYVDVANDGNSIDLYMPDVTFFYTSSYSIPKIDIVVFSISETLAGVYGAESVVIREIEDHEILVNTYLNAYSGISNIEAVINNDDTIKITFDCKINSVTRAVMYVGTKE